MKQIESKRNDTKQLIFDAALELFAQRGYREVSIRDIAEKVKIRGASIYYHYASKEEILNDILDFYDDHIIFYIQELSQTDLDAIPFEEYAKKMHYQYKPEEMLSMSRAGQVVLNELFNNRRAAESLLGSRFKEYTGSYETFLKAVALKMGLCTDNCKKYAELFSRISLSFMMEFQLSEMFDPLEISNHMDEVYRFLFAQFLKDARYPE